MEVNIYLTSQRPSALVTDRHNKIEHLKHVSNIIAVSRLDFPFVVMNSCKGGVGKSTVAVNLALAYRFFSRCYFSIDWSSSEAVSVFWTAISSVPRFPFC